LDTCGNCSGDCNQGVDYHPVRQQSLGLPVMVKRYAERQLKPVIKPRKMMKHAHFNVAKQWGKHPIKIKRMCGFLKLNPHCKVCILAFA